MISRDELAARFAVAAYGGHMARSQDSGNFPTDAEVAKFACEMADALLSALAPKPAEAPPAPTVAPLTEEEREELAQEIREGFYGSAWVTPWDELGPDTRSNYLSAADAAAEWFAKRGAK